MWIPEAIEFHERQRWNATSLQVAHTRRGLSGPGSSSNLRTSANAFSALEHAFSVHEPAFKKLKVVTVFARIVLFIVLRTGLSLVS
jgi:hypothetical protein